MFDWIRLQIRLYREARQWKQWGENWRASHDEMRRRLKEAQASVDWLVEALTEPSMQILPDEIEYSVKRLAAARREETVMDSKIKIYRVNEADWIATDRSKQDTAKWYGTEYDMGDPEDLEPLDEWEDVSLGTEHFRDVYEQIKEDGTEDKETMGETIEAMLAKNRSLPFLVSTTEW